MATYNLTINNESRTISAEPETPLLWILRDELDLTGTKYGCGIGLCGACTVIVDGNSIKSCAFTIAQAEGSEVLTIEGLSEQGNHVIQKAWTAMDVPQCGYCQTGFIMATVDFLSKNPQPSDDEINQALQGNMCRCGTYPRIRKAIHHVIKDGDS